MSTIQTERWEPVTGQPGRIRYAGQRKVKDVYQDLETFLKQENLYPDEYLRCDLKQDHDETMPCVRDVICYAQWGSSEGIYLEVELIVEDYNDGFCKRITFATGKTLSETDEAFDRMQYIAGRIYRALA